MNLSDGNDQIWITEYDLSRKFTTRFVKQSDNTYRSEFRHDLRFGSSSAAPAQLARAPRPKIGDVRFSGEKTVPAFRSGEGVQGKGRTAVQLHQSGEGRRAPCEVPEQAWISGIQNLYRPAGA